MFSIGTLSLRCAAEALSSHGFCSHSLSFSLSSTRCSSIPLEFRVLYIRVNLQCDENTFDANICVWGDVVACTRTKKCTFHVYQIVCMLNRNVFFSLTLFLSENSFVSRFHPGFFSYLVLLNSVVYNSLGKINKQTSGGWWCNHIPPTSRQATKKHLLNKYM